MPSHPFYVWCSYRDTPWYSGPVTGQSLITSYVINRFTRRHHTYSLTPFNFIQNALSLFSNVLFSGSHPSPSTYIVSSRSFFGFIRDLPALILVLLNARVIIHVHGSDLQNLFSIPLIGRVAVHLYSKASFILSPSRFYTDFMRNKYPALNFLFLPNFLPPLQVNSLLQERSFAVPIYSSKLTFLWNSNIMSSKGVFDCLHAFERISQAGHQFRFLVIGTPISDCELSADESLNMLRKFFKYDWFEYLGPVSFENSLKILECSDVVCLPSRYPTECSPLALLAAIHFSKNIVTSDLPQMLELLESYPHQKVFLSSHLDSSSLLHTLLDCLRKASLCRGNERVSNQHSDPSAEFDRILLSALSPHPGL